MQDENYNGYLHLFAVKHYIHNELAEKGKEKAGDKIATVWLLIQAQKNVPGTEECRRAGDQFRSQNQTCCKDQ